ncbi:MAG TPA: ComEC/Rec2 family competence protein [Gaiellaceae bacterium]|nr:ComEC/Rec2 family competence protein [Gaiellaceae bacterium]
MIVRPAPAHVLVLALAVGLALANFGRVHAVGLAASAGAATALVLVDGPVQRLALLAVVVGVLGWWWGSHRLDELDRSALLPEVGRAGRAVVVVTGPPAAGRFESRAQGVARMFDGRSADEPVELELELGRSPPQGAVLDALVQVRLPPGPENGFDERTWLRRRGIHVTLRVDEWTQVGSRGGLGGLADRLRAWLARSIAPGLTGERRAVLEGIVLGDGSALSPGLKQDFQASGLYHILAVSGQNVVLVAAGALTLAWILGVSRWIGELGALAGIAAYVLAVGPQASVIRAGIAGALASLAWITGRLRDAWQALLLGAVVLLAWNPYNLYDPGFQLSFVAVAAIFTVVPAIARRLESAPLPRTVRMGVAVSLGCSVVTAPILWLQFGYLPLAGVPANVLVEPAMPVLLGLAFVTAVLDLVAPGSASVLAWVNGWTAAYIALCARAVGSLPFAEIQSWRGLAGLAGVLLPAGLLWHRAGAR